MKRVFLILAIAALSLPPAALSKGPSGALISGPGAGGRGGGGDLTSTGCCTPESPTMTLAEHAGFFLAVFPQEPNPMLASRPKGDLGPRYTITYTVPGPSNETWRIRQDVYPYATPAPVTYMEPGQEVFEIVGGTRGGWFRADPRLKETLVSAGLPANAPASSPAASSDASAFPTNLLVLLIASLLVAAAATAVGLRSIGRWPFPSRSTSTI
jgi:hypothetical protein